MVSGNIDIGSESTAGKMPGREPDRSILNNTPGKGKRMILENLKADYVSKKKIFGIPLLHISSESAQGVVAIGEKAIGVLAVGRLAIGVISSGAVSIGVISAGAISVGLVAAAGAVALGFGRSAGAIAAGRKATGALAFGARPQGGLTVKLPAIDEDDDDVFLGI
ncbi:MAG: hypothetical protein A2Z86_10060 [Candidatus Glassbacteria bacterium GWA2_58_10]|uniref:Uncharacterized protein n=2 Tax=Candidatus Glassiibacteriota TaxID=1817805 RepID=A0A1F5YD51_9BACT|nr:MAG: hypothetical protein A2Z86_10060 [Candidatus Glassbacteria bacterium GWA2_58_10]